MDQESRHILLGSSTLGHFMSYNQKRFWATVVSSFKWRRSLHSQGVAGCSSYGPLAWKPQFPEISWTEATFCPRHMRFYQMAVYYTKAFYPRRQQRELASKGEATVICNLVMKIIRYHCVPLVRSNSSKAGHATGHEFQKAEISRGHLKKSPAKLIYEAVSV